MTINDLANRLERQRQAFNATAEQLRKKGADVRVTVQRGGISTSVDTSCVAAYGRFSRGFDALMLDYAAVTARKRGADAQEQD